MVFGPGILENFKGLLCPVDIVINSVYREWEISRLVGVVDVDGSMRVDWQGEGFRRWPLVSARRTADKLRNSLMYILSVFAGGVNG